MYHHVIHVSDQETENTHGPCFYQVTVYANMNGSLGEREMLWQQRPTGEGFCSFFRVVANFQDCF